MNKIRSMVSAFTSHPMARGSIVVFSGTMVSNVLAYLYQLIVGRMLGPERYGELAAFMSLMYLLSVPAVVMQTVVAKYVSTYKAHNEIGKVADFVKTVISYTVFFCVAILVISIPFYEPLRAYVHAPSNWYVFYSLLASIIVFFTMIAIGTLQGLQKFMAVMIFTNLTMVVRLAGGIIGAARGVGETLLANTITTIVGVIIMFIPLAFLQKTKRVHSQLAKLEVLSFAAPSLLTIFSITSLFSTDIIMVKHYFSSLEAGLYAALALMGKVVFFAGSSISYVLFPIVAERQSQGVKAHKIVFTSVLIVALISGSITLGYFLVPDLALGMLFGKSYAGASSYLGLFGVFVTLYALCNVLVSTLLGSAKVGVSWLTIIASISQVVLISVFHTSLYQIITINIGVCLALFILLLLYYRHEQ